MLPKFEPIPDPAFVDRVIEVKSINPTGTNVAVPSRNCKGDAGSSPGPCKANAGGAVIAEAAMGTADFANGTGAVTAATVVSSRFSRAVMPWLVISVRAFS